jgi:gamma-glutamyl-gamma-aminobutyrate hydrolase PuuD
MKTFDTYEEVVGMNHCMKRPIVVHAKKIEVEFEENLLSIFKHKTEIRISSLHDKNAAILGNAASVFLML